MDRDDDRIGRYPEADAWPEFEAVQSDPRDMPDLLIGQGIGRYTTAVSRALEKITGNRRTILTGDQEYTLGLDLERGRRAKALIDEDSVSDAERALLLADIRAGDAARERLILANLKLAAYFARASMNILTDEDREDGKMIGAYDDITKLASPHGSLDDRIGFANEGLIKAVDRFKPVITPKTGKPVRFSTHAAFDIHGMLSRRIEQTEHGGIRPPSNFSDEISRLRRSDDEADARKLAKMVTYKERIGTRISVDEMRAAVYDAESDNDAWDEHERADIRDVYFDPEQPTTERLAEERSLADLLESMLNSLSEREASVIRMRFGLPPFGREMTFDEIGKTFGVTRERVRQIESRTMAKLRHPSRSEPLSDHLDETIHPLAYRDPLLMIDTDPLVDVVSTRVLRMGPPAPRPAMESWQTEPDEEWDAPVRFGGPETDDAAVDAAAADAFTEAFGLFKAATPGDAPSYPAEALDTMTEAVGDTLAARHVETLWNDVMPRILERTPTRDVDPTTVSLFFAALLTRAIRDDDAVYLKIPERLSARMDYFGYGLKHGTVTVDGDLGDYAGMQMGGLAALEVKGNVGNDAGNGMDGFAELRVAGNAGRRFGSGGETAVAICGGTIESAVFVPERPEKRPVKVRRSIARTALTAASLRARILAQTGILESLHALGDDASPHQMDVVSGRINNLTAELSRLEDGRRDAGLLRGHFDDPS